LPTIEENIKAADVLRFVRFEFLSVSSLENFVSSDFDLFSVLTRSIWQQISRRLILSVSLEYSNDPLIKPRCEAFLSERKPAVDREPRRKEEVHQLTKFWV
jgi:hypothetical protein